MNTHNINVWVVDLTQIELLRKKSLISQEILTAIENYAWLYMKIQSATSISDMDRILSEEAENEKWTSEIKETQSFAETQVNNTPVEAEIVSNWETWWLTESPVIKSQINDVSEKEPIPVISVSESLPPVSESQILTEQNPVKITTPMNEIQSEEQIKTVSSWPKIKLSIWGLQKPANDDAMKKIA